MHSFCRKDIVWFIYQIDSPEDLEVSLKNDKENDQFVNKVNLNEKHNQQANSWIRPNQERLAKILNPFMTNLSDQSNKSISINRQIDSEENSQC